jgi:hypothetical protein
MNHYSRCCEAGVTIEEEGAISHTQYLDLVYSQSRVLYDIIKDYTHPSLDPSPPTSSVHVDGVIGTLEIQSKIPMEKYSQKDSKNNIINQAQPSSPGTMSYVNVLQSSNSDKKQNNDSKKREKLKNTLVKARRKPLTAMLQSLNLRKR